MKQIHYARDILKLDGANASLIAKRVGRSPRTIQKWMRYGIPKGARDDCIAALKRHQRAISNRTPPHPRRRGVVEGPFRRSSASGVPRRPPSAVGKKETAASDLRPSTKKKAISTRQSAIDKRRKPKAVSGQKPIAENRL